MKDGLLEPLKISWLVLGLILFDATIVNEFTIVTVSGAGEAVIDTDVELRLNVRDDM